MHSGPSLTRIVRRSLSGDLGWELPSEIGQQHVDPLRLEHGAQLLLRLPLPLPRLWLLPCRYTASHGAARDGEGRRANQTTLRYISQASQVIVVGGPTKSSCIN